MTDQFSHLTEALNGRYTIKRELGTGGMATVYLARDIRHETDVAWCIEQNFSPHIPQNSALLNRVARQSAAANAPLR